MTPSPCLGEHLWRDLSYESLILLTAPGLHDKGRGGMNVVPGCCGESPSVLDGIMMLLWGPFWGMGHQHSTELLTGRLRRAFGFTSTPPKTLLYLPCVPTTPSLPWPHVLGCKVASVCSKWVSSLSSFTPVSDRILQTKAARSRTQPTYATKIVHVGFSLRHGASYGPIKELS